MTKSNIAQIVTSASSLSERLSKGLFTVDADQMSEQQAIDERIEHWCQVAAQGNWEKFQKRLLWDGLDVDEVRHALGSVPLAEVGPLPSWAKTLSEIIQTSTDFSFHPNATDPDKILIEPENPLPFEDILLPAVLVARQKLLTSLGCASLSSDHLLLELLSFAAYLTLERSLLERLVNLCAKTLELEFSRFRPLGHSLFNLLVKQPTGSMSKAHYNAFVQKLLQDGLLALFQKYPVLGRLVATTIDFWVEATVEFLQRLKADKAEIQQLFSPKILSKGTEANREGRSFLSSPCPNSQLGKVIEIHPNLSDPHNRGRCVIAIEFESGLKLVYKPKNLGLEVAHNQFLDWCNQHGAPLPFKVLKVSDHQTYGWVEYVEQLPIEDALAAQRFYQRAGMLMCILYLLQATDCHNENLIACGEHLVLVDMETLMHREPSEFVDSLAATVFATTAAQQLFDSVLRIGLLPCWEFTKDKRTAYEVSGLSSVSPEQAPTLVQRWKSVNTDDMRLGFEKTTLPVNKNEAIFNGVALSPNNYIHELVEGFEQMYRFLMEQRSTLFLADGPLAKLQARQVRFMFRNTQVYSVVLQKSLAPECLQNGVDRSIELDILSRALLACEDKPKAWSILQSELRAMEQLDIPHFGARSNSDRLTIGVEQPVERYFNECGHTQVLKQLQALNEKDLAQQVAIIQSAFYAKIALDSEEQAQAANTSSATGADFSDIRILSAEQLLESAQTIAQSIQERAIRGADGSVSWIGLGFASNAERFQLQSLDNSLYDGNCGIALFLAALARVKGDNQFHDLALRAIQSLRKFLQTANADSAQRFARTIGIGGASGLGSIVYCLVKTSQFLQKPALLEDAQRAANLIVPELITADRQFDLMAGAAGAILGLLALHAETGEPAVLDKAIACGQHLLAHRISVNGSPRAWKNFVEKPLTGFSHGAAGIAYALLRLYGLTHKYAYKQASIEGIAYERSVFQTSAANWPDFRSSAQQTDQPGFMISWCHGAPGIGLARLGSLEILDTEEIHQDIEVALQTTQKYGLNSVDHLCCGNFGRIEVLLVAAKTLRREELFKTAHLQASMAVARAEQAGSYQLFSNLPTSVFSPSFFRGTAGIGYELLRLAYPEILPSVLLLA